MNNAERAKILGDSIARIDKWIRMISVYGLPEHAQSHVDRLKRMRDKLEDELRKEMRGF